MKIYLVWDGYEDIAGVFLRKENANLFYDKLRLNNPRRAEWAFGISEHEVEDSEGN